MSLVPNLILHNANIITMDAHKPVVQAVACFQGRIVAIGSDHEILALSGPGTKIINLHGATVIPGLNDSEIPAIIEAAKAAGAQFAGYTVVRLPFSVKEIFALWLEAHFPG
ncbi:MAG: hypothetical protein ACK46D_03550, partial [Roseiflexaceae bacterium]